MRPTTPPLLPLLLDDVPHALSVMLGQEGVPTAPYQPGRTNGTFVLFDSRARRTRPQVAPRQQAIDLDEVRKTLLSRGQATDPFAPLAAGGVRRAAWLIAGRQASEELGAVDRRAIREQVIDVLRCLVTERGGVWMRLGRYPAPYHTAANFRFDHDDFVAADFDRTLDAVGGNAGMTTHFVCGSTHEGRADSLRRLAGLDVGSHGYRHHTYRTFAENVVNIRRGIDVLHRVGIEPSGFAAPHGRYNSALAAAMNHIGITHSSEFGLANDDLPFTPADCSTLQLPIHPFCLGIALESIAPSDSGDESIRRRVVDGVIEHFTSTAAALHAARMPIFFYGHPDGRVGRYPDVLTNVFETIGSLSRVWRTTMTEFQHWWRLRRRIEVEVTAEGGGWRIEAERLPAGYLPTLEVCTERKFAAVSLDRARMRIDRGGLQFTTEERYDVPSPVNVASAFDLKAIVRRMLDWERVTPIEEIESKHLVGLVKKTLRRIRG